jgi:hypothetical protein
MNDSSKQHGQPQTQGAALNPSQRQGASRVRPNKAMDGVTSSTGSANKAAILLASHTSNSTRIITQPGHARGRATNIIAEVSERFTIQLTSP